MNLCQATNLTIKLSRTAKISNSAPTRRYKRKAKQTGGITNRLRKRTTPVRVVSPRRGCSAGKKQGKRREIRVWESEGGAMITVAINPTGYRLTLGGAERRSHVRGVAAQLVEHKCGWMLAALLYDVVELVFI